MTRTAAVTPAIKRVGGQQVFGQAVFKVKAAAAVQKGLFYGNWKENMNKRLKKKFFKKLHGHNPDKQMKLKMTDCILKIKAVGIKKSLSVANPENRMGSELPCITVARILTAQRAAGHWKRTYHTRNRR